MIWDDGTGTYNDPSEDPKNYDDPNQSDPWGNDNGYQTSGYGNPQGDQTNNQQPNSNPDRPDQNNYGNDPIPSAQTDPSTDPTQNPSLDPYNPYPGQQNQGNNGQSGSDNNNRGGSDPYKPPPPLPTWGAYNPGSGNPADVNWNPTPNADTGYSTSQYGKGPQGYYQPTGWNSIYTYGDPNHGENGPYYDPNSGANFNPWVGPGKNGADRLTGQTPYPWSVEGQDYIKAHTPVARATQATVAPQRVAAAPAPPAARGGGYGGGGGRGSTQNEWDDYMKNYFGRFSHVQSASPDVFFGLQGDKGSDWGNVPWWDKDHNMINMTSAFANGATPDTSGWTPDWGAIANPSENPWYKTNAPTA